VYANAAADRFSVSADAYAFVACQYCAPRSHAIAESSLSFRVLQDADALLAFSGSVTSWTYGFFGLFDQTTGTELFSQEFGFYPGRNPPPGVSVASVLPFSASLDASHIYKMTLRGEADANFDAWNMSLGVTGLVPIAAPVPEPEAWAMMLIGLGAVGGIARRRRARPV
jgi:hypothetical protein